MTNLKRLIAVLVLVLTLSLTAFADCPVPGQIETPCLPSAPSTSDDPTSPGQMDTPPNAVTESLSLELSSLVEFAFNALTLF